MDTTQALLTVTLGGLLGLLGQAARVVVGIKKEFDSAKAPGNTSKTIGDWFDTKQLIISLLIGAVAGAIAAISSDVQDIDKKYMLGIMASGYAGSDFIEGFMSKIAPK
jgi:hypothetical protein